MEAAASDPSGSSPHDRREEGVAVTVVAVIAGAAWTSDVPMGALRGQNVRKVWTLQSKEGVAVTVTGGIIVRAAHGQHMGESGAGDMGGSDMGSVEEVPVRSIYTSHT